MPWYRFFDNESKGYRLLKADSKEGVIPADVTFVEELDDDYCIAHLGDYMVETPSAWEDLACGDSAAEVAVKILRDAPYFAAHLVHDEDGRDVTVESLTAWLEKEFASPYWDHYKQAFKDLETPASNGEVC